MIRDLPVRELTMGRHQIELNAADIPSGIYLIKVETNQGRLTKRFIIAH